MKKILITEDEPIAAMSLKCMLEDWGYHVLEIACSGPEAIRYAEKSRPDLVLMDIKLQGKMDGIEAIQSIRARSDVPVIFMSGYADDEIRRRARSFKEFSKLEKPIHPDMLREEIERILAERPKKHGPKTPTKGRGKKGAGGS
jgi:CheY-like chemotaxis protein